MHTRRLTLAIAIATLTACSSTSAPPAPAGVANAAPKVTHSKLKAVNTALAVTATSGALEATMTLTTEKAVRGASVTFILPADARLLSGALDTRIGDLPAGVTRTVTITLQAPTAGRHALNAHVTSTTPSGRTLHAGDTAMIGPGKAEPPTRVKRLPDGSGVRLSK